MTWPTLPNWQDAPSTASPLDAANLDIVNTSIEDVETAVGTLQPQIPFTALQTTSYTASANQYVLVSTASGSLTVTLPTAPPNFTVVGVKQEIRGGTNTVTVQAGGSDTFDASGTQTSTLTLPSQAAIWQYNSATTHWIRTSDDMPLSQLEALFVQSVTNTDGSITVTGTSTAPVVSVNQSDLVLAQSQVTGLPTTLANSAQPGGIWDYNMFADLASNMSRDDAITAFITTAANRTNLMMIGLCPPGSYSVVRLCVTVAGGSTSVFTAALFGSTSLTSTSWARLGSGNVTISATTTGVTSTSLPFTLSVPTYVMLELVLTTYATPYPTLGGSVSSHATLINPTSGAPVVAVSTGTTAPGSTLNPTGFTNSAQKIWCALA